MTLFQLVFQFVRRHWPSYAISATFLIGVALLTVWIPKQIGSLVDTIASHNLTSKAALWQELGFLLFAGFVIYLLRAGWRMRFYGAAYLMGIEMRQRLYARLAAQAPRFFQTRRTGDLMALATNDVDAVEMAVGEGLLAGFDGTLTFIIVIAAMLFAVDWRLAAVALLPFPFMAIAFYIISGNVHRYSKQSLERFGKLNDHVQEHLSGLRSLRALGLEQQSETRFASHSKAAADTSFSAQRWEAMYEPAFGLTLSTSMVASLAYGGYLVWNHELSVGELTSFGLYLVQLIWPMFAAGWVLSIWQRGRAAWTRLSEVLNEPLAVEDDGHIEHIASSNSSTLNPSEAGIRIHAIGFSYSDNTLQALSNFELALQPGQTIGIVGPTGSGKSTLIKLLLRQWHAQQGSISWNGHKLEKYSLAALRKSIAWVPQEPILFSVSVRENIALAKPDATIDEIVEVAKLASIHDDILLLPNSYETLVGERGVTLSGGQRQRVAIARALLQEAPLLLLDDALSAVDSETEHEILSHLKTLRIQEKKSKSERIVLIVSHRLSAVQDADKIAVLQHGRLTEFASHQALLAKGVTHSWYAQQWRIQQIEMQLGHSKKLKLPQGTGIDSKVS